MFVCLFVCLFCTVLAIDDHFMGLNSHQEFRLASVGMCTRNLAFISLVTLSLSDKTTGGVIAVGDFVNGAKRG